jgi:hypothetical protein
MSMIYNAPTSERHQAAFSILADIVQRWYAEGRRAYGASLKPEMRSLTSNAFDEKLLGFMTFKHFLLAAADQGLVDVHPAPNSPDVQVVPKGKEPMGLRGGSDRSSTASNIPRIREDLWKAFVDWNTAFERFYDRAHDVAHRIASAESAFDSPALKTLRQEKRTDTARFVPILPITFAEQVDWMRQFAAKQPPETRLHLMPAIESARPARDFSMTVRRSSDLAFAWQNERFQRVMERIDAWKSEHNVVVDIYAPPATPPDRRERPVRASALSLDERRLRERIHGAIDAMSVAELLDLPIRLHHIVDVDR